MSKILLFGTSFSKTHKDWEMRYKKWYDYYTQSSIKYSNLLIIDDGSPILPQWNDLTIINAPFANELDTKHNLIHFSNNLGRPSHLNYPGWFRSFRFAIRYAKMFNYEKIIHIETDAYVISNKLINFINEIHSGWQPLYCKKHLFPESAIQIIGKDCIDRAWKTVELDYATYFLDRDIERIFPFTNVITNFEGDRYFEYINQIPINADYACQVPNDHKISIVEKRNV